MTLFTKARELKIEKSGDEKAWAWHNPVPKSDCAIAELNWLDSLEISATIECKVLKQETRYGVSLVYALRKDANHVEKVNAQIRVSPVSTPGSSVSTSGTDVYLAKIREDSAAENRVFPKRRPDGWMEATLGEFYKKNGENYCIVNLSEKKTDALMHGIYVVGIEVRPLQ